MSTVEAIERALAWSARHELPLFPALQLSATLVFARSLFKALPRALYGRWPAPALVLGYLGGACLGLPLLRLLRSALGNAQPSFAPGWASLLCGVFAAAAVAWQLQRRNQGPALSALAAPLALLIALSRLGCVVAGCCFGEQHGLTLRYAAGTPAHAHQVEQALLPAGAPFSHGVELLALYEASCALLLFVAVRSLQRAANREGREGRDGAWLARLVVASYAVWRLLLDGRRADRELLGFGLSLTQWLCIAALALMVALADPRRRRAENASSPNQASDLSRS